VSPVSTIRNARAKDVAEEAGVSVATVSRVINKKYGRISPDTVERVMRAAERLQYKPDPRGLSLRTGSTRTLGLIVPDIGDQYFQYIAKGAETAARERGYGIVFCNTDRDPDREFESLEFLADKGVDGVVLCGGGIQDEEHLAGVDWGEMSVVAIGPHQLDVPTLRVDNHAAMRAAVAHFAEVGRRRVFCIAGERDWHITRARLDGALEGAEEFGIDISPELVCYAGFTAKDGADAVSRALAEEVDFDAVLAFNDYAAVGAMGVLADLDCLIPEQVAIIGCDDTDISAYARVPLTTIRFPTSDLGRTAVKVLCDGAPVPVETFGFELVVRHSTVGRSPR
jgi:LacI family transcriptional regulator, galactose operon repressor